MYALSGCYGLLDAAGEGAKSAERERGSACVKWLIHTSL
jgi:hypothetical protein